MLQGSLPQPGSSILALQNTELTETESTNFFALDPCDFVWSNGMSDPLLVERQLLHNKLQEERIAREKTDERRRDNIMPLELAMKREMAYRAKITRLQLQNLSASREAPTPSQLPLPNPHIGELKRESPSNNHLHLGKFKREGPRQPPSHSRQPNVFCEVCQVSCSSGSNLKQHYAGSKHKAKLEEWAKNIRNGGENWQENITRKWCKVCGIPCVNEMSLKQHFTGKKHALRLQEIKDAKKAKRLIC